ncbi:hypothetical protein KM043_000477 [Ampulex compressa]|nr:hypothetical protein KM043_000477 [Ampulex compressa]
MLTTLRSLVGRLSRIVHQREMCKMVILVRTDLPMGRGKTAAQCAHAALQCYVAGQNNRKERVVCQDWLNAGQPKIVLRVQDEEELLRVAHDARSAGLIVAVIKDAGRTQVESGTISVLGIGPGPKERVDRLTSKLKLL